MTKPLLGFSLLIILGFLWGTGYSIARFAMTNGVTPFGYSFWQSLGPAIIIGLIAVLRRTPGGHKPSHITFYFICGLTGIAVPNTAMYFTAAHLPASVLAMVVNIVPIVAYPLALLLKLENFRWLRLLGIALAICGLMLLILPRASMPAVMVPWILFALITPFSFALCSIYIARYRPDELDTCTLAAGMLISSSILLTPMVFFTHHFYLFHLPLTTPDWVILLEIILSSMGYLLLFYLIKVAGPVYYSLVDTIVVLTGLFWGHMIFGEQLNQYTSMALLFILSALILVTQQQRMALSKPNPSEQQAPV